MFNHGSYVYQICTVNGISLKHVIRESDMLLFMPNSSGESFTLNGTVPGHKLPQLLPSSVHVYNLLCQLYGSNNVPKPMITLTGLELLVYLCENKTSSYIKCIHNNTEEVVKIFDVIGDLAVNSNSRENYFWHELTPITNEGIIIASVETLYRGDNNEV